MDVNPGSPEAILKGCLCARLDNNWGAGMYTDPDGVAMFSIRGDCPVHGRAFDLSGELEDRLTDNGYGTFAHTLRIIE
jgi:hypothetical protein